MNAQQLSELAQKLEEAAALMPSLLVKESEPMSLAELQLHKQLSSIQMKAIKLRDAARRKEQR